MECDFEDLAKNGVPQVSGPLSWVRAPAGNVFRNLEHCRVKSAVPKFLCQTPKDLPSMSFVFEVVV